MRHPWVFSDSISKISPNGAAGDLAIIYGKKSNRPMAVGLYDPESPVAIKVLHHDGAVMIDSGFFEEKIKTARQLREPLLQNDTDAYRLLFGENDGFPGLIVDIYGKAGVIKLYSPIWLPYLDMLVPLIVEAARIDALLLRLSRHLQRLPLPLREGDLLHGTLPDPNVVFSEYGVRFKANLLLGHKTGFFLDHRANRHQVGQMAQGKKVLDVFAYAGGFSVHALAGGAAEVTSVDISRQALELALENGRLNSGTGQHHLLAGDAFELLENMTKRRQKFDIVIIDPPSFAKSAAEVDTALRKYARLAELGAQLTARGGTLLLASCSSRVTADTFFELHREVFSRISLRHRLTHRTEHDIDHPVRFPEGAYLKTGYYEKAP